jgi:hypothetical protein
VFTIWAFADMSVMAVACVSNGITSLRYQTIFTILAAIIKIPLTIFVAQLTQSWVSVIAINVIVYIPLIFSQHFDLTKKIKDIVEV